MTYIYHVFHFVRILAIEFRNQNSIDSDTTDEQDEQAEERVHQLIKVDELTVS